MQLWEEETESEDVARHEGYRLLTDHVPVLWTNLSAIETQNETEVLYCA